MFGFYELFIVGCCFIVYISVLISIIMGKFEKFLDSFGYKAIVIVCATVIVVTHIIKVVVDMKGIASRLDVIEYKLDNVFDNRGDSCCYPSSDRP